MDTTRNVRVIDTITYEINLFHPEQENCSNDVIVNGELMSSDRFYSLKRRKITKKEAFYGVECVWQG